MNKWTCPKCKRIFSKKNQMHSCKSYPIENHFKNKPLAKSLYDTLFERVKNDVGKCEVISLGCCIHWFGTYDFIALLPKKDHLEIRLAFDRKLDNKRITNIIPLSKILYKHCLNLHNIKDIDKELISFIKQSYNLRS